MIKLVNKYLLPLGFVIFVIIAVILRSTGTGRFRYDSTRWAEPSFKGSNLVTPEKAMILEGDIMVIALDRSESMPAVIRGEKIYIAPDSILEAKNRKFISGNNGPVLLYSSDLSLSAKIWMLLSQTGLKNIYILSEDQVNEVSKEKFRPDTIIRPE